MTEWLLNNFYNILPTIETFRPVGYLFIFLFAVLESVAFAGLFVPGTLFTIFFGFLVAQGTLTFGWSAVLAISGAIIGDGLSFYLGRHSGRWFKDDSRWLKKSYLDRGQKFFEKHGAKSVFIGRFVGPIRPFIPFVAGLSNMKRPLFFIYNFTSATLWGLLYLGIGYYLGKLSLDLTGDVVRHFELGVLILGLLVALLITWWSLRQRLEVVRAWARFLKLFRFRFLATNSQRKIKVTLVTIILILFYYFVAGSGLVLSILENGLITNFDNKILPLVTGEGGGLAGTFFIFVTNLGNGWVLIVSTLFSVLLLARFDRLAARGLIIGLFATEFLVYLGKILIGRGRPPEGLLSEPSFSFPSGHAAGSLFFYGFLTFLAWRYIKRPLWRQIALVIFPILIVLIGFSRLYFGVHFFSDIVGGYILGGTILLFALFFVSR